MKRAPFSGLLAALALTLAVPSLVGCGPAPSGVQLAKVQAGSLPAGETFKGVWYNPVFGDLHMVPQGTAIVGKFKSQSSGVWGKVHGEISGDLIKFEWEEHKTGAIGPGSTRKGKGYFKFVPKEAPEQPALRGEWGLGDNEVGGGDWDCIRQKDVEPKLESIGGEADPTIGGGWDAEPTPPSGPGSGSKTPPPKKLGHLVSPRASSRK